METRELNPSTNPTERCTRCGASLPVAGAECPSCLLRLGARESAAARSTETNEPDTADRRPHSTPSLADVRAAFPGFEIEALLGSGGMGAVFKARQRDLDRMVALKVLPRELAEDPAFSERFLREARALARLTHPGIVAVHEFGRSNGFCFLAMEFVDGLDLRRRMREGAIEPRQALAIARDLCDALQYAHDEGVVHRDIKPENVLVDARGRVKLADFGLAKLLGADGGALLTRTDQVMGTPHYMAPEQIERPRDVDHRADIFAIGVVLYEMLTGSLPRGQFEPPSHRVKIDVRLDEIVLKALAREPERRYQQALEVKSDVDRVDASSVAAEAATKAGAESKHARTAAGRRTAIATGVALGVWILLAASWNGGPMGVAVAFALSLAALGLLVRHELRRDVALTGALALEPASKRRSRVATALMLGAFGLFIVGAGHVLHWERGTDEWHPSFQHSYDWQEAWTRGPFELVRLVGIDANGIDPVVSLRAFKANGVLLAERAKPLILIMVGIVLLACAVGAAFQTGSTRALRTRSWVLGAELASFSLAALLAIWLLAPVLDLRGGQRLEGLVMPAGPAKGLDAATDDLRVALREVGLEIDIEQELILQDRRTSAVLGRARIVRACSSSAFDRWSTGLGGPVRSSPELWITLASATGSDSTACITHAGLYDPRTEEYQDARAFLDRLQARIEGG